jgi:hypothetical protein
MPEERESDYVVHDIHPGPYGDGKNFFILLTETGRPWAFNVAGWYWNSLLSSQTRPWSALPENSTHSILTDRRPIWALQRAFPGPFSQGAPPSQPAA